MEVRDQSQLSVLTYLLETASSVWLLHTMYIILYVMCTSCPCSYVCLCINGWVWMHVHVEASDWLCMSCFIIFSPCIVRQCLSRNRSSIWWLTGQQAWGILLASTSITRAPCHSQLLHGWWRLNSGSHGKHFTNRAMADSLYPYICLYACVYVHVPWHTWSRMSGLTFLKMIPHFTAMFLRWAGPWASGNFPISAFYLTDAIPSLPSHWYYLQPSLRGFWVSELRFPFLCRKSFTHWDISPDSLTYFCHIDMN